MYKSIVMNTLKVMSVALLALSVFSFALPVSHVHADAKDEVCKALTNDPTDVKGNCNAGGTSIETVIEAVVNVLTVIVGIVAVIMIIIGGFKYVTSGGDSNNVASAKNTIIYAIVGLIVVVLAQVIVRFILNRTT